MAEGTVQNIDIGAPAADVYRVAAELADYPTWAQGVKTVQVLESDAAGLPLRASFVVDAMMKEITYELRYTHDVPNLMTWEAVPGPDIKEMQGSYKFTEDDGVTSVVYALRVDPSFPVPGFIRRQAEKTLVGVALRGLKRQVENSP